MRPALLVAIVALFDGCAHVEQFQNPASLSEEVYQERDVDAPPYAVRMNRPLYPVDGTATIQCVVRKDGTVARDLIVGATNPTIAQAAAQMVMKWRFRPALLNGERVNCVVTVPVSFPNPQPESPSGREPPMINNPPPERTH